MKHSEGVTNVVVAVWNGLGYKTLMVEFMAKCLAWLFCYRSLFDMVTLAVFDNQLLECSTHTVVAPAALNIALQLLSAPVH